ncbi:MAG: mannonate dehydratase [Verrucomicrobiales bacterium]|jgi:mannonate dehydratase
MKLALFLTPMSDHHLALAAQIGVTDIVAPYPGTDPDDLIQQCERAAKHDLKITVIERHVPHDKLVHNKPGQAEQLAGFKQLIRNMSRCGVHTLCYNWMPDDDWQRTSFTTRERGGALVTKFDLAKVTVPLRANTQPQTNPTTAEQLWQNLTNFLKEITPFAEDHGVTLALHPDDPPLANLHGQDRIIIDHQAFERVLNLNPSPANQLCYCQGTFASGGQDIPIGIRKFAKHIAFAHFRDVQGTIPKFRETFHDNGQTNMAACIRAYQETNFTGPIRPDHVPTLASETNANPGYEMLGRLHAIGYMKGLIHASQA